jgi:hypothetical protein
MPGEFSARESSAEKRKTKTVPAICSNGIAAAENWRAENN